MLRQILILKFVRIIYTFVASLIMLNLDAYDQIVAYVKMLMTKLLTLSHGLLLRMRKRMISPPLLTLNCLTQRI
jgi:hypothetical protein